MGYRRVLPTAAAVALTALVMPAASPAALQTFGSDLSAPADTSHPHRVDTAFWATALPGGNLPAAPADGQVREVRIRGIAPRSSVPPRQGQNPYAGSPMFHTQVLTPHEETVKTRSTSQDFFLPTGGDPQQVSVHKPVNQCISAGEYVAFNTIGGYDGTGDPNGPYPDGTPFQIFAANRAGAGTRFFDAHGWWIDNAGAIGMPMRPRDASDQAGSLGDELLMQIVLATGDDRSYECGGPNTYRPPDPPVVPKPPKTGGGGTASGPAAQQAASIPGGQRVNVKKNGSSSVSIFCPAGAARCTGRLTVSTTVVKKGKKGKKGRKGARKTLVVARASFDLGQKSTAGVAFKLTKAGHKLYRRKLRLPVTITAVTDPGGGAYTDTYKVTLKKVGSK